jgi:hypothetical protein
MIKVPESLQRLVVKALKIFGFSTGSVLFVGSDGNISQDNANLFWDSVNKRLGIGTMEPNEKLEVVGNGNFGIRISNLGNTATDFSAISFYQAGSEKGVIYTNQDDLYIRTPGAAGQDLLLQTNGGNVGIGTTTPNAKLEVSASPVSSIRVGSYMLGGGDARIETTDFVFRILDANRNRSILRRNWDPTLLDYLELNNVQSGGGGLDDRILLSQGLGILFYSDGVERMRITPDGNVGIGTTAPTAKVDVVGVTGYNQLRLRTPYTPTGSADPNGNVGDIAWDDNYIYVKTSVGWKRAALSVF